MRILINFWGVGGAKVLAPFMTGFPTVGGTLPHQNIVPPIPKTHGPPHQILSPLSPPPEFVWRAARAFFTNCSIFSDQETDRGLFSLIKCKESKFT